MNTHRKTKNKYRKTTARPVRHPVRRPAGIALVELMIALAISASLLTATAFALDASIQAFHINQEQAILLQNSRLAMHRILATVRRCKLHAPENATLRNEFAAGRTTTGSAIAMFDVNDILTTCRYDPATKMVLLVKADGSSYPLLRGVEEFNVTLEPMRSSGSVRTGSGWDLLRRATLQITVRTAQETVLGGETKGTQTLTLSGSVMPRRNTW